MASIITSPSNIDILCGKDKTFNKHPGNLLYRQLIEEHAQSYTNECSKQIKMKVTKDIVNQLERSGARFIRKIGTDRWKAITNQEARDKTSHALRYCAGSRGNNNKQPEDEPEEQQQQHQPAVTTSNNNNNNNNNDNNNNNSSNIPTPIRRFIKRAAKAKKREHRRIVSNDYNNTFDHPFSNRLMAPLFDGGLHDHSFVSFSSPTSASSSSMTMLDDSSAALPEYCLSLHPSISLSSIDEVNDEYDNNDDEASSNDYCYNHHHHHRRSKEQVDQHEKIYGCCYDTTLLSSSSVYEEEEEEESSFLPDQVASTYYYYSTPPTTMMTAITPIEPHTTTTNGSDDANDDNDFEQILLEPLGVVSRDDNWDDHPFYYHHQSS